VKWTPERDAVVRAEYPHSESIDVLAVRLGCSRSVLRSRANRLRVFRRQPWTDAQTHAVREKYGKVPATEIAREINRPVNQVYQMADRLGVMERRELVAEADRETIRRRNADGWVDSEIAAELGWTRECVCHHRRAMGLPSNALSERRRQAVREKTQQQLEHAGLPNLGAVRRKAYRDFARENGWPADLRPRAVQILNLLATVGVPLTRRQIADGIGMSWKGSRKSLRSNDPEGSYLAHLAARGLVAVLPRGHTVFGQGKGRSCHLYLLGPVALAMLEQRAKEEFATCPTTP
jgi:hypothetical protein